MAFAKSGSVITQSGTDTDLSGLASIAGVTNTYDGVVRVYTLAAGDRLDVTGTLTINPQVNRLISQANYAINVTGTLNLGSSQTRNGFTRDSEGVAIVLDRAPSRWHGSSNNPTSLNRANWNNIYVASGGSLYWRGATITGPGNFVAAAGSALAIEDGVLRTNSPSVGSTDPTTGSTVASGTTSGIYQGTSNRPSTGRGFISWIDTANHYINGFTLEGDATNGGAELILAEAATGNNTLVSGSPANGIFNLSSEFSRIAAFPNSVTTFTLQDTNLAGGNDLDLTIQTEGASTNPITATSVYNDASGTALKVLGGETVADVRNRGNVHIYRYVDFDLTSLATGDHITGGRYYCRDTNNGFRSDVNSVNDTGDYIYSEVLSGGAIGVGPEDVLLGTVKVTHQAMTLGSHPQISSGNRTRGTTNDPNDANAATNVYTMDLRGKVNTLGNDTFDFYYSHPQYDLVTFSDVNLSDGTTGNYIIRGSLATDAQYQSAGYAVSGQISTLDELYKAEKERKSSTVTSMGLPAANTFYLTKSGSTINLGSMNFLVNPNTQSQYQPGSTTISIYRNGNLTAGTHFDSVTTTGFFSPLGDPLPAITLTAGSYTQLVSPGANAGARATLDRTGGVYNGPISLSPGFYQAVGDWSGVTLSRDGSSGTVDIAFTGTPPESANIGTGITVPVNVTIEGRNDPNGKLSMFTIAGSTLTTVAVTPDANGDALVPVTGGLNLVVVYTAPGRTDFYQRIDSIFTDQTVTITSDPQPYPTTYADGITQTDVDAGFAVSRSGDQITINMDPSLPNISNLFRNYLNVNRGLQLVLKGTDNYNSAIAISGVKDLVGSRGITGEAFVNNDYIRGTSAGSVQLAAIEQTGVGGVPFGTMMSILAFEAGVNHHVSGEWVFSATTPTSDDKTFSRTNATTLVVTLTPNANAHMNNDWTEIVGGSAYINIEDSSGDSVVLNFPVTAAVATGNYAYTLTVTGTLPTFTASDSYRIVLTNDEGFRTSIGISVDTALPGFEPSLVTVLLQDNNPIIQQGVATELTRGTLTNIGR